MAETHYLHSDLIGSTWFMSDDPSQGDPAVSRWTVRTAFGELVGLAAGPETRYGYAGAWGYQTHDIDTTGLGDGVPDTLANAPATAGFPFIHVGARYYDPATGRFLQRDPIGIWGGSNVYVYARANPVTALDPSGLQTPTPSPTRPAGPPPPAPRPQPGPTPSPAPSPLPPLSGPADWAVAVTDAFHGGVALVCEKVPVFSQLYLAFRFGQETGENLVEHTDIEDHVGELIFIHMTNDPPPSPDPHRFGPFDDPGTPGGWDPN